MSADFPIGFAVGAIFATCLWTLGYDLLLKIFKKEVKVIDKQKNGDVSQK